MTLNQRERSLVIGLGVVVGLLGLWFLLVKPFFERGAQISRDLDRIRQEKREADDLLDHRVTVMRSWNKMKNTGVLRSDPFEAGQEVINVLQRWAQETNVSLSALTPESPTAVSGDSRSDKPESKFKRVNIKATAVGSMRTLSDFLWRVESSPRVVRVMEIQIQSRKPGTDDLQMELTLATLSPIDTDKGSKPGKAPPAGNTPVASSLP